MMDIGDTIPRGTEIPPEVTEVVDDHGDITWRNETGWHYGNPLDYHAEVCALSAADTSNFYGPLVVRRLDPAMSLRKRVAAAVDIAEADLRGGGMPAVLVLEALLANLRGLVA